MDNTNIQAGDLVKVRREVLPEKRTADDFGAEGFWCVALEPWNGGQLRVRVACGLLMADALGIDYGDEITLEPAEIGMHMTAAQMEAEKAAYYEWRRREGLD